MFKIGQKVVCIDPAAKDAVYRYAPLKENVVYTILDIVPCVCGKHNFYVGLNDGYSSDTACHSCGRTISRCSRWLHRPGRFVPLESYSREKTEELVEELTEQLEMELETV